jgi:hypothetical protein
MDDDDDALMSEVEGEPSNMSGRGSPEYSQGQNVNEDGQGGNGELLVKFCHMSQFSRIGSKICHM